MELPLYQCHKKVRAAKIEGIAPQDQNGNTELYLEGCGQIVVDPSWKTRNPALDIGGYFVEYQEGDKYTAYSPAGPFESGYTKINE